MHRQIPYVERQFNNIPEPVRACLALTKLAKGDPSLALMLRAERGYARQLTRAMNNLLALQQQRRPPAAQPQAEPAKSENAEMDFARVSAAIEFHSQGVIVLR